MTQIGELIVKMRAESATFTTQMEQNRRTVERTHQSVINFGEHGSRGFKRVENAAAGLGLGMVGLHGKSEQLISGMLLLGAGGQATLLITAGLAAILLAHQYLASAITKTREEQDKLIDSLNKRLDPNTGIAAEVAAATKRVEDLKKQIKDLQARSPVQQALDPFGVFGGDKKLERMKGELAVQEALVAQGNILVKQDWLRNHPKDKPLMGPGQEDWVKNALQVIDLAQSKLGQTDQWADIGKKQAKAYTDALGSSIDSAFEKNKDLAFAIQRPKIFEKMERDAKLFEETWKNAVRGVQESFADFFDSIGQEGFRMISLLENIAKAIRRTLAEVAAQKVVNALLSGFGGGGGGGGIPGAPNLGNLSDNPIPSLSTTASRGPAVHVTQHVTFNAGFVDAASGEAWLQSKAGTIAAVVARAASDAPAFARYIVARGSH